MDRLSRAETVAGFYGLGLYWGNARSQNAAGHVVRRECCSVAWLVVAEWLVDHAGLLSACRHVLPMTSNSNMAPASLISTLIAV